MEDQRIRAQRIIPMKPKTIRSITDHIRKQLTGGQK